MARLYFDINVHGAIIRGLRLRGVDLIVGQEDGQDGVPDPDVMDRATELGCLLVSCDDDMLAESAVRLSAYIPFGGIYFIKQNDLNIGVCVDILEFIARAYEPHEVANAVLYESDFI